MENEKNARIQEIDKRLEGLIIHQSRWARAGGVGGSMAMKANAEIEELRKEKEDILNDTQNIGIDKKHAQLRELKELREKANFLKKWNMHLKLRRLKNKYKILEIILRKDRLLTSQ